MARDGRAENSTTNGGGLSTGRSSAWRRPRRGSGAEGRWAATATVFIAREIDDAVRRDVYERPLARALGAAGLGAVLDAGQMVEETEDGAPEDFEHSRHVIELALRDATRAAPILRRLLREAQAARGVADGVSIAVSGPDGAVVERLESLSAH